MNKVLASLETRVEAVEILTSPQSENVDFVSSKIS